MQAHTSGPGYPRVSVLLFAPDRLHSVSAPLLSLPVHDCFCGSAHQYFISSRFI
ncbi:MAG: hypothetical protein AAF570_05385 [Bacteroidota bacterium]